MKKPVKNIQKAENNQQSQPVDLMKALEQSKTVNSFQTNYQFTKDLGVAMLQGQATPEHINVLTKSIEGLEDFIDLLKEKMKEQKGA